MKLRQNAKHFAYRKALETPGVRSVANAGLVRLHTKIFTGKADPAHAEERTAHLDGLFDATMDTYLRALQAGFSEAEAREITHIQANFDFYNHGWTEMMEIPVDELEAHYERYGDFFERWDITIDDPLGQFEPPEGIPEAPSTPERLDEPEHPHAEGGFADDVYVETEDGDLVVGSQDEPDDVDVSNAVDLEDEDIEAD
ncbi:hypothetical protein Htur_3304 [Haloterrigena turkmenica DSM 5511]|uniref:Uncharacterized protein n=1 Tax=Haloterrigena turkmenica (strain ATCC 51198 / DSM 5511 / JCM 9101 / NCIMB 13204 / VKM B-1734 / 4k) TaxID=543526 RepID=D2RPL6_HALTV|nr:DUF6149 family protein [Haloterrigena turkmenica]ADB62168.1 hypothetical protein Htur_3304 [Haloterrigena turkmenica DSM 5511]